MFCSQWINVELFLNLIYSGVWDPNIRIEPPKTSPPPQTKRLEGLADHMGNGDIPVNGTDEPDHQGLERTGRWESHAKHILIFKICLKKF